ncbi:MAG TPA: septal ring lytic transglycosylase RlpA family protein [Steroidobacteraceae bacterium]|nr:septal ring lytic transglycosylase RlpA family protein [Steroidobacteraceae bacterium]
MRAACLALAASLAIGLVGCSSAPPRHNAGSVASLPAPGNVADAVPRAEARSSHGNPPFYDVNGQRFKVLTSADNYVERGVASWYGPDFHGHNTSSGERYDMYGMTAAHKTLPIPCYARITNLSNGRSVVVRINDRGPFVGSRIVDLSYSAATRLDIVRTGTAFVELRTIGPGAASSVITTPVVAAAPPPTVPAAAAIMPTASILAAPPALKVPLAEVPQPTESEDSGPVAMPVALYIQVGAYADEGNAQRVIQRLQGAGIPQVFSVGSADSARMLRRVRIGPIATVEEFDRLAAQLTTLGYPDTRLAND